MSNIEDIEKAVENLPPAELSNFRIWFEAFEATRFDQQIEHDVHAGKLDQLAEMALSSFRKGYAREL